MAVWMLFSILLAGFVYSVRLRMGQYRQKITVDPKLSPVSSAIQDLVAIAGGIYLSLIMLVSFLKVSVPEKIYIYAIELDPLAFLAICLGIVQPIVMNLIKRVK